MSGYKKNYTPTWTKGNLNPSTYSGSSSSKIERSLKYGGVYPRPASDPKPSSERSATLRLGQKYGHFCDGSRDTDKYAGPVTARLKEIDKKETAPPPVSYRSISRPSGTRSRDPSAERETTERMSTLSIHNCNSLYPTPINVRSVSHDRSDTSTPSSTIPKYTGRSSITKSDKFGLIRSSRNESKEDLTKFKTITKATSREDLDSGPKKYITSRFLPKNTIEKSNTAYLRPCSARISSSQRDSSRKNREILNLLSAQTDRSSRPTSRCSNVSDNIPRETSTTTTTESLERTPSDLNSENSKSAKVNNTSATPWSSYLDLKFSSPKNTKASPSSSQSQIPKNSSSNKQTVSKSFTPTDSKSKLSKSSPKTSRRSTLNKDFRKSVLNMSPESKMRHHNGSVSPADSEAEFPTSEATDVSENLSSCMSYHKQSSSASRLPKKSSETSETRSVRSNTRSPSVPLEGHCESTTASGSEDDVKTKSTYTKSESKISKSHRTSLLSERGDGSPKPPMSPRPKTEKESFLTRALTPVAAAFKIKRPDSDSRVNWMDSSTDKDNESGKVKEESKSPKIRAMRRIDSGERAWWLDESATPPEGVEVYPVGTPPQDSQKSDYFHKYRIRHIDSGEKAWWLSSNENISEAASQPKSASKEPAYKITHQVSGERAWWMKTPPKSHQHSSDTESENEQNIPLGDRASPDGLEMPKEEEQISKLKKPNSLFISKHKNIDDILGGSNVSLSPLMEQIFNYQERRRSFEEVQPNQVKIHDSTPQRGVIQPARIDVGVISSPSSAGQYDRLDDASLQLYKDGDYGSYLDLDASISEQQEEFEGFQLK
ncbi:micronuclear linker histone polyprotein-like [Photinus pyralis]|uniref:micronuclear linker histone polyprotein-like n=1 Tax=Photinus pyralis TaxID=7054 RepID=UPI0012677FF6|nr:micronuclear linker histone polyprotein-like [Photinus pyralis]